MSDFDQKARMVKLQRTFGQSPAERERISRLNAEFTDWRGVCRRCGVTRTGSLADLREPCPTCGAKLEAPNDS